MQLDLKNVGIVLTTGFGILGLLTEFKDKQSNRLTRWGLIAVVGTALSALLALLASKQDDANHNKEVHDQLEHSNQLLSQILRISEPLDELQVAFWMTVPISDPGYLNRLQRSVRHIVDVTDLRKRKLGAKDHRDWAYVSKATSPAKTMLDFVAGNATFEETVPQSLEVTIPSDSPYYPQRSEVQAYTLTSAPSLTMDFYKDGEVVSGDEKDSPLVGPLFASYKSDRYYLAPDDFHFVPLINFGGRSRISKVPDLELPALIAPHVSNGDGHCELIYSLVTKTLTMHCWASVPRSNWTTRGTISYLSDLLNAKLFFRWGLSEPRLSIMDPKTYESVPALSRGYRDSVLKEIESELQRVVFSVRGEDFTFTPKSWSKPDSNFVWLILPRSLEQLRNAYKDF